MQRELLCEMFRPVLNVHFLMPTVLDLKGLLKWSPPPRGIKLGFLLLLRPAAAPGSSPGCGLLTHILMALAP